jgi:hypothetical protein
MRIATKLGKDDRGTAKINYLEVEAEGARRSTADRDELCSVPFYFPLRALTL